MKKFLCLKDLVMKADGKIELTAGRLYRETKPISGRENAVINNSRETHNNVHNWGIFVETFERDGVEWIEHTGGDCPVPGDWLIRALIKNGFDYHVIDNCADWFSASNCPGAVVGYRIISTGEQEGSGAGGGIDLVEQGFEPPDSLSEQYMDFDETPESRMHEWSEVQKRDHRDPSPQEAAYAAKVAAMEKPEPEPKKLPARCLDDVEFCNLLGMNQFVRGGE